MQSIGDLWTHKRDLWTHKRDLSTHKRDLHSEPSECNHTTHLLPHMRHPFLVCVDKSLSYVANNCNRMTHLLPHMSPPAAITPPIFCHTWVLPISCVLIDMFGMFVGLFWKSRMIAIRWLMGLFYVFIGLVCVFIGLLCVFTWKGFVSNEVYRYHLCVHGLFCVFIGLFCVFIGLFCVFIGLFCVHS